MTHHYLFSLLLILLCTCGRAVKPDYHCIEYIVNYPDTLDWQTVTSADGSTPNARHEAAFVRVGDSYYLLGGRGIQPVDIYDPETKTWTEGAKPPVEIHHFQPVVVKDDIYLLGAMTGKYPGETPLPEILIYNVVDNAWRTGPTIPENRRRGGAGAVLVGNKIYLMCGITDGHRGGHVAWLDSYDLEEDRWEQLPDAPRPRDHFQAVAVNGFLYAVAGRTTISSINPFAHTIGEVDVYDLRTNSWETLSDTLPTHRAGNAAIAIDHEIFVVGGESTNQMVAHSEVEVLNTYSGQWTTMDSLNRGRHGTGVVYDHPHLIMASGCGNRGGKPELADMIVGELK